MTRRTPIILVSLLVAGAATFAANAFLPVPSETYCAIAGGLMFASGMIFGLIASFRSLFILARADLRRTSGIVAPLLVLIITTATWFVVVTEVIQYKRSMDKRAQYEMEHPRPPLTSQHDDYKPPVKWE